MTRLFGLDVDRPRIELLIRWGARAEDASSVAKRLEATLRTLERIDGTPIDGWVKSFTSTPVLPELEAFVRTQAFRDEAGAVLPKHGYHFRVSRPASELRPRLELSVKAGSGYGRQAGHWVNSVELVFRGDQARAAQYFSKHGPAILDGIVGEWAPDFGYAGVTPQRDATAPHRYGLPGVLAVTWLSDQFSIPEEIPGAEVHQFAGGHIIFVGSAELADSSVAAAVGVHSFLVANGLGLAAANQPQV